MMPRPLSTPVGNTHSYHGRYVIGPLNEPWVPVNSPLTTRMLTAPIWFWSIAAVPWIVLVWPLFQMITPLPVALSPFGHSPWPAAWNVNVPPVTDGSLGDWHWPTSPCPVICTVFVWKVMPGPIVVS